MLWAQSLLPFFLYRDKVDLFWSPAHRIPFCLPKTIPSVVTIHDLVWKYAGETMRPLSRYLDSKLMKYAIINSNQIIAVSNSTANDICLELPKIKHKINTFPLAATTFLQCKNINVLINNNINKSYILFVGTIEPRKNLNRLIEAFSKLDEELKSKYLLVIAGGEGWGDVNVKNISEKFNVSDITIITGYVSEEELGVLYSNALFLVMPSLYEGFGLPLIEAMQYGTPALTSNISSMPEVVGDSGFLVNPYEVKSITNGLNTLLSDAELLKSMRLKCKYQFRNFNWDKTAKSSLQLFINTMKTF